MSADQTTVKTTCPYCGVGCGVIATVQDGQIISVKGDDDHPANFGRLCSKGSALHETVGLDGRLLTPEIRGEQASWDDSLDYVAAELARIRDAHGPESIAMYVSGQLLTEDYYVANKFVKGALGTGNIDTNSRLCMSSAVAAYKRAFGSDTVPICYEDLEKADLIVLCGSNLAWCHPILFQRVKAAKEANPNMKLVVIDPRKTDTCDIADIHLPISAGTDVWLWNGLASYLAEHGKADFEYLEANVEGFGETLKFLKDATYSIPQVAMQCDVGEQALADFYRLFANTEKVISGYSMGVNQSSAGTDKANSIINCHLITGRVGKEGAGPFSITGQPNAMGGREVGGLSNMLAAHMDFDQADRVQRFWETDNIATGPGLKAVDLFERIESGEVKAVWIMATNPVVSLPNADQVKRALEKAELVVVSDVLASTDTVNFAHVKLPALGWGEKDGTVTNSERRISRQRKAMPAPGEAKADWWMICEVAKRMGYKGFGFETVAAVFDEHARLSGFENDGQRDFDISGLAGLELNEYEQLVPVQWPVPQGNDSPQGTARLFTEGRFFTPSGKARVIPIPPRTPANGADSQYPFVLNTGRIRDQWHTMTRTGKSARLSAHIMEPFAQLHPFDAERLGIEDDAIVKIESRWGTAYARAMTSEQQRPGNVFVPIHWNEQNASKARIDAVVNPVVDPISGEPEFKHTPVSVGAETFSWYGFLLSRKALLEGLDSDYWVKVTGQQFYRFELAGNDEPEDWQSWLQQRVGGLSEEDGEWAQYADANRGLIRLALFKDNQMQACLFISRGKDLPSRNWLSDLFAAEALSSQERIAVLSARPPAGQVDKGRTVCSCFGVGENTIREAIAGGCGSVEAVTAKCQAGGNCGSCIPEIKQMLSEGATSASTG